MGIILDKLTGNPLLIEVKESDLDSATRAKIASGEVAGTFTAAFPTRGAGVADSKVYEFVGTNATIPTGGSGETYYNGDKSYWNGTIWVRIPFQSLSNYYTKADLKSLIVNAGVDLAIDTTYTVDKYLRSDGGLSSFSGYRTTDFILIKGQTTVNYIGEGMTSSLSTVFYAQNKTTITGYVTNHANNAVLNVPTGSYYVRASGNKSTIPYIQILAGNYADVLEQRIIPIELKFDEIELKFDEIEDYQTQNTTNLLSKVDITTLESSNLLYENKILTNNSVLETTKYINYSGLPAGGALEANTRTPVISINGASKLKYNGNLSDNTSIGFYNSSTISVDTIVQVIKYTDVSGSKTEIELTVPFGSTHICCSTFNPTTYPFSLVLLEFTSDIYNLRDSVELNTNNIIKLNYDYLKAIFGTCICIGDSITQGWRTTGIYLNQSYPFYLNKLSGWTVENSGVGGYTPKTWYLNKFALYDFNNFDVAVICLGQNEGLTNTIAADTASGNYNTYADTNTGVYCKIIEAIKAQNPEIKIMLLSRLQDGKATTWNVVYDIAEKYSIPIINFIKNGIDDLTNVIYHPHSDTVHFGTIGNLAIANVVFKSLLNYVYANQTDYETYKE